MAKNANLDETDLRKMISLHPSSIVLAEYDIPFSTFDVICSRFYPTVGVLSNRLSSGIEERIKKRLHRCSGLFIFDYEI
jgi:hypothetical protein